MFTEYGMYLFDDAHAMSFGIRTIVQASTCRPPRIHGQRDYSIHYFDVTCLVSQRMRISPQDTGCHTTQSITVFRALTDLAVPACLVQLPGEPPPTAAPASPPPAPTTALTPVPQLVTLARVTKRETPSPFCVYPRLIPHSTPPFSL